MDSALDQFEFFEPEVSHQLSNVICTTLRAVKSELCLVQLQQESSDEKPEISKQSVGKARGIVEFLFKKVEQDVEEAKVGFHITPGKKLSILPLSPRASHLYRARLASVWRSSNASLPHNILVEIAAQISLAASVKDIDHKTLSESNAIVARSFHAVIRHMQEEAEHEQRRLGEVRKAKEEQESSGRVEELWERDEEREMHGRRMIVLSVLDRTFQQCYSDLFQREDALVETEDEEAEEEEMMTEMIKQDDMSKVIHFMERVVSKVSGGREDHDTEDTVADDDSYITDVVVQATLRTLDHVKAGELVEDDLDKLCRAFFLDMTDSSAREEKQEVLEKHLRALLVDVREGRVQRKTLQQATKELGLKTFDKKTRPVLSVTRSRDQEFLRRALSGILQGLTRQGPAESRPEQQTLAVKKIDFKRRCISESYSPHDRPIVERGRSKSVGSPTVAMPEFQRKTPLSRGAAKSHSSERHGEEEPDYVHVGLNRAQSIEERTISKTNVADDTANRKSSTGGRFELYATTQSLPPLCDQESDQLLVVTEGSEPGSTLSYLSQVPSKTEEVDEPEEGEEQAGGTADVDSDEGDTKSDATSEAGDDQSMASERDASEPENEPAAASGRETPVPSESENEREDAGSEAEAEGSEKAESEAGVSEAGDADVQEGDAGSEAGEEGVSEAGDESERTASENEQDDVASDAGDGSEKEASENEQDEVASDAGDGSEKEASEHAPEDVAYEAGDGSDKAESESEADGSETQQEDAASEAGDEGIGSEKGESDKEDPEALEAASEHGDQNENKAKTESLPSAASDATDIMCTTRRPTDRTETAQPRKTAETSGKAKLTAAKTKASASKAGSSKTVSKHGERKTEDDENGEDESVQLDSKGVSRTVSMTSGSKASLEASRDFNRSAVRSTRKAWMVYVDEVPEQEHLSLLYKGRSRSRHSRPPFTTHLQGVQSSHTRPSQFTSSHLLAGEDKRGFRSSSSHRNFTAAVNPLLNDWRKIIKQIGRPAFGAGAEENGSLVVRRKKARHESRKKKHKKKKKMKKKKEAEYSIQLVPPRIETPHPPSEQRRLDVAKFWVGDMAMTRREGRTAMVSSSTLVNRPQNSRSCTPTSRDLSRTSVPSEAGPKEGRQRSATIIRRETSSVTVCTLSSTDSATTLADAASMRRSTCGNVAENETQNATEGRKKSLSESAACESRDTTGEPISQQNANQHHMGHSRRFPRYPTFTAPAFAIQRAANALSASTTSFPDVMDLKACQRRSYDFGKTLFDRKQKEKWLEHQKHKEETRSFLQCVKIPHPPPQPTPHEAGRPSTKYVEWGNSKISPLDTQRLATATACAARRVRKMLSRGQVEAPVFPMAVDKRVRMGSVGKQEG
nr:hypothetical protein BaRGS_014474 [Batillaria attramentaria]